jgi:hypothetical protein
VNNSSGTTMAKFKVFQNLAGQDVVINTERITFVTQVKGNPNESIIYFAENHSIKVKGKPKNLVTLLSI